MADLKLGLIGTGAIGDTHIERINNVLQGAKVVAVSDAFAEAGKLVAEKYVFCEKPLAPDFYK